jgi:hypothetical protein
MITLESIQPNNRDSHHQQFTLTVTPMYKLLHNPLEQTYQITITDNDRKFTLTIINASQYIIPLFTERESNFHKDSLLKIRSIYQLTNTMNVNKLTLARIEIYGIPLEMIQTFKKLLASNKCKKPYIYGLNTKWTQYLRSRKLPFKRP